MVKRRWPFIQKVSRIGLICLAGAGSAWMLLAGEVPASDVFAVQQVGLRAPTGSPQLVSYLSCPEMGSSEQCLKEAPRCGPRSREQRNYCRRHEPECRAHILLS